MLIALMARDKPGHLQTRKDNRDAHLAYIEATGVVTQAGPLLDEAYSQRKKQVDEEVAKATVVTLVSDGWHQPVIRDCGGGFGFVACVSISSHAWSLGEFTVSKKW